MAEQQFYTLITNVGQAKLANATALGTKVSFVKVQVGDGRDYNPNEAQESLKHKVWEGNINSITTDSKNPNWIVIQTLIPASVGGFNISEVGVFDDEGNMLIVSKYPETYKPKLENGSGKDLTIKLVIQVSNTESVTLKIDPSITIATKEDIKNVEKQIENIKVPVQSVNGKTGKVILKAEDITAKDGTNLEKFKENVTTQYEDTTKALNNFGGRNYLLNSDFRNKKDNWITFKAGDNGTVKFNEGSVSINNISQQYCGIYQQVKDIGVNVKKNYIISFYAKSDIDSSILCGWTVSGVSVSIKQSDDYIKYSINIGSPRKNGDDVIILYNSTKGSTCEITKVKVEVGYTATDWNISPEEVVVNSKRLDAIEKILIEKGFMTAQKSLIK
ncbi:phage tail protein [Clostridium novyi]|uniref:phage tail protein n=1 Tax=Clostridium novyi TaxID=1542 RepID=UPI0004DB1206|nr:phage tail protein [Clostridium novyi]KEH88894.1 phage tail fiber protein [Clostridium novyi A str. GD211209]